MPRGLGGAASPSCCQLQDVSTERTTNAQPDDEEAAKEEEAEALRLQRKEAEALRPEDFGQPSEPESEEEAEDEDEEAGTLGAAAARVCTSLVLRNVEECPVAHQWLTTLVTTFRRVWTGRHMGSSQSIPNSMQAARGEVDIEEMQEYLRRHLYLLPSQQSTAHAGCHGRDGV